MPFFRLPEVVTRKDPRGEPLCGVCGLNKGCKSPKMKPSGEGKRKILICGEAPGEKEDNQGRQFVGATGQFLRVHLESLGIDTDRDCWLINAASCRPKDNKLPPKSIEYCRPKVVQEIKDLQPEVILLLGNEAVKSVIGWLWKPDPGSISRWAGYQIPCQKLNCWIVPTFHPSYVKRNLADDRIVVGGKEDNPVVEKYFDHHLEQMAAISGRPWAKVPDWKSRVECLGYDLQGSSIEDAAEAIRGFLSSPLIAFDLESNSLKPDNRDSRIHSCSISNGKRTIAFPWKEPAISAMKELLLSNVGKIGWNIKHEHRWIMSKLGIRVNNWRWDGMINAHILDNRRGVAGLKFQAFARLGMSSYEDTIKNYLQPVNPGSHSLNRIEEADLGSVLRYGGLDSLLTFKLAKLQAEDLGVTI